MNRRQLLQCSISTAAAAILPTASRAQQYPTKIIRFLVGFPPGGSADSTMRQFAHRLDAVLGAKHVIENVAGASSTLAAMQTLRAEPDGHTLFLGSNVSQVIAPVMLELSYDPLTALAPISQMTTSSSLVAVSAGYGAKDWAEFLAKAKGERDGVFYGTSNVGFQLPAVQISKITGIKLVNVPFKGGAEAVTAVLGGNIPMIIGTPPTILPHVNSGALVALCATSAERSSVMPDIPGANEVGLKGIDSVAWFGLFAPRKTPVTIIARLHAAIQSVIGDKSLQHALARDGAEPRGSGSPEAFASFQKKDYEESGAIIREAGLAPN